MITSSTVKKIGTPTEIFVEVPFYGNSLIQAVVNGVAHDPESIFRMPAEGGVDTDQNRILKVFFTAFTMHKNRHAGDPAGLPVRPETRKLPPSRRAETCMPSQAVNQTER